MKTLDRVSVGVSNISHSVGHCIFSPTARYQITEMKTSLISTLHEWHTKYSKVKLLKSGCLLKCFFVLVYFYTQIEAKQTQTHTHTHIIIINPLTARAVGAPQMILQPVFSIFPCSPPPSGTCRTPGLSIPWCCLPTSSFVRLVFFPLSLCLARWFRPDLMNGRHDHTTAVCVSLRSSGDLHVVQLPAGSWHGLPRW